MLYVADCFLGSSDNALRETVGLRLLIAAQRTAGFFDTTFDVLSRTFFLIFVHGCKIDTRGALASRCHGKVVVPEPAPRLLNQYFGQLAQDMGGIVRDDVAV